MRLDCRPELSIQQLCFVVSRSQAMIAVTWACSTAKTRVAVPPKDELQYITTRPISDIPLHAAGGRILA